MRHGTLDLDATGEHPRVHPRPLRGATPARARRSRDRAAAVAPPWTLPLRAAPQALDTIAADRPRVLAKRVQANAALVGTLFDFAAETGLLTTTEIGSALDTLEAEMDGRRVASLFDKASSVLARRLDARVGALAGGTPREASMTFYIAGYDDPPSTEHYLILDCETEIEAVLPVFDLDEPVALLAYHACRWMDQALGLDPVADWTANGPGAYWLLEQLDEFRGMAPEHRESPEAFLAEIKAPQSRYHALDADDLEQAAYLLAKMQDLDTDLERIETLIALAEPLPETAQDLLAAAHRSAARYPEGSQNAAWCAWVVRVAETVIAAGSPDCAATREWRDETHPLESRIGLSPGLDFWRDARQEVVQVVYQTGEPVEIAYPWSAGRGPSILSAMDRIADAIGLLLSTPEVS